jgi:hypothetical protein
MEGKRKLQIIKSGGGRGTNYKIRASSPEKKKIYLSPGKEGYGKVYNLGEWTGGLEDQSGRTERRIRGMNLYTVRAGFVLSKREKEAPPPPGRTKQPDNLRKKDI